MLVHRKQKIGVAADHIVNGQGDTAPQDANVGKRSIDIGATEEGELVYHQLHRRVRRDRDRPAGLVISSAANLLV